MKHQMFEQMQINILFVDCGSKIHIWREGSSILGWKTQLKKLGKADELESYIDMVFFKFQIIESKWDKMRNWLGAREV